MNEKKIPKCLNPRCAVLPSFPTWKDLALHITTSDIPHSQSSRIWAAHCLADVKDKKEFGSCMPMSDDIKQLVKDCVREVSGRVQEVRTVCPDCHQVVEQELPIEFIQDRESWRNSKGTYVTICEKCKPLYRSIKIKRDEVGIGTNRLQQYSENDV